MKHKTCQQERAARTGKAQETRLSCAKKVSASAPCSAMAVHEAGMGCCRIQRDGVAPWTAWPVLAPTRKNPSLPKQEGFEQGSTQPDREAGNRLAEPPGLAAAQAQISDGSGARP